MRQAVALGSSPVLYGETPYGWRLTRDRSRLVVNGDEQRVIAVVRHMYFAKRVPMREVVKRLKEMGVINRRGRPFGLSSVWEMIHHGTERPAEAKKQAKKKRR
jgi:site-specific DNA recombinase